MLHTHSIWQALFCPEKIVILLKKQNTLKQTHIQMTHLSSATLNSNLTRTNNLFRQILKQFYNYVNPTFLE